MNNIFFEKVTEIGKLYLEHVFYEFEKEPILFSCVDEKKILYLCLCADIRYGQKWIVTPCSNSTLKALIKEKIDIASAFLISPRAIIISMDLKGNEESYSVDVDQIDRLDLPEEGTYIRCDKDKANNYLWNKEREALSVQMKAVLNTAPILGKVEKSYCGTFNKTIRMKRKQKELYHNSVSKRFVEESMEQKSIVEQSMTIRYEYSIHITDRYAEIAENLDNDNFSHAA